MATDPTNVTDREFLDIAVRQNLLTKKDAVGLKQAVIDSGVSMSALCIEKGLLRPVQIDVIRGLAEKENLAPGYEVIDLLGHGGLGIVYRARQPKLDRMIALKTIPMNRIENPSVITRFKQEAKAIGKLKHPNIVAAYDFGTYQERLYLAMELVEGRDVDALISSSGQVSESLAWSLAQQVAAGLAHAAQHNLVHRDIKPGNLLLTRPPAGYPLPPGVPLLKITDFGLVQLETPDATGTRLTMGGTSLGTPHYMAPEQIADAHVDSSADIYALGATVFHMIAGKPPFDGTTIGKVLAAKLKGDESWIERLPDGTTPETVKLLKKMLASESKDRIQDYDTLLDCIGHLLNGDLPTVELANAETLEDLLTAETNLSGLLTKTSISIQIKRRNLLIWSLAALALLVGVVALLVRPAQEVEHPLPPETKLAPSGWERSLFNGADVNDWKTTSGLWFSSEDEMHSRVLSGKGVVHRRLPTHSTSPDQPLEHYGLRFNIDLKDATFAELHFEHDDPEKLNDKLPRSVVLLTKEHVMLGTKAKLTGEFQPLTPEYPLPADNPSDDESSQYHEIRLERHADHWRVILNGITVTSKRIKSEAPMKFVQFHVSDGQALFGDVFVYELILP